MEKNGQPYLEVHVDREALPTKGKHAIGGFLKRLQIYKSTADSKRGIAYFQQYLEVLMLPHRSTRRFWLIGRSC